jgi:hypothetical protein
MKPPLQSGLLAVAFAAVTACMGAEGETANAGTERATFDFLSRADASTEWRHRPEVWQALTPGAAASVDPLGGGWSFNGEVVKPFRGRGVEGIAPGVLQLVTPLPLENPETSIPRFAWTGGRRSWTEVASAAHGFGRLSAPELNHEPRTGLFSFGR